MIQHGQDQQGEKATITGISRLWPVASRRTAATMTMSIAITQGKPYGPGIRFGPVRR
jgi:hypothetical protein